LSRSSDDRDMTSPTLPAADQMQPPHSATSVPRPIPLSGPAAQRRASIHALTGWSSLYAHPTMADTKPHENTGQQPRALRTGSLGSAFGLSSASATGPPPLFATSLPSPSQRTAFPPGLYHPPASAAKDTTLPTYQQNTSVSPPAHFSGIPTPFRRMSYSMGTHPGPSGTMATANTQPQSRPTPTLDGQRNDNNERSPGASSLNHYQLETSSAPSSAGQPTETSLTWNHSATDEGAKARKIRRIRTQPPRPESPMGKMILSGQFLD
ncbi:hypothetical protein H4R34_005870, partial [Dimargaris verticillata]